MATSKILRARAPFCVGFILLFWALLGCKSRETSERGEAPPPLPSPVPGVCNGGGGQVKDPISAEFFPRLSQEYCIDPNGEARAYGKEAEFTLDDVCTQLFDGECEVYKGYGLTRVVTLRYVDGKGSPGAVQVNASTFEDEKGAFGFFGKRVIGDSDPLELAPRELDAGALGSLGSGVAYAVKGKYVLELSYTNELFTPDQLKEESDRSLPAITRAIATRLPGDDGLPPELELLPPESRLPLGRVLAVRDVLGIKGAGSGAIGYYQSGGKRWRVLVVERPDPDAARDIAGTLKKGARAPSVKDVPYGAFKLEFDGADNEPPRMWWIARHENRLWGVGDEDFSGGAEAAGTTARRSASQRLSDAEKHELLGRLLSR